MIPTRARFATNQTRRLGPSWPKNRLRPLSIDQHIKQEYPLKLADQRRKHAEFTSGAGPERWLQRRHVHPKNHDRGYAAQPTYTHHAAVRSPNKNRALLEDAPLGRSEVPTLAKSCTKADKTLNWLNANSLNSSQNRNSAP